MISEDDVYKIGTLTRTHGVRGEIAFLFTDDVWDRVEADYLFLQIDGLLVPFFLEEWRFRSDSVALLKFEEVDSADVAARYVGSDVYFPKELTPEDLDDGDLTWRHFIGFDVFNVSSSASGSRPQTDLLGSPEPGVRLLGTVSDVLDQTANVLLVVTASTVGGKACSTSAHPEALCARPEASSGELLIPAHEDFVLEADHRQRRLLVCVPEELLTLNT